MTAGPVAHLIRSPALALASAVLFAGVLAGCGVSGPVERLPAATHAAVAAGLGEWDEKWAALQSSPQSLSLADHWRVCGLKFRFRNYADLFRCLDLIEARVALLDEGAPQRRYAPVIVGWMRADAYAELGETAEAARSADIAWSTLPNEYHEVSGVVPSGYGIVAMFSRKEHDFAAVAIEAGGSEWVVKGSDTLYPGLNNPAGLDMRPQTIAMSLAAERAVLYQRLGKAELAKSARQDLQRWKDNDVFYFAATALSMGPSFAMGDYAAVVKSYEVVASRRRLLKTLNSVFGVETLGLKYLTDLFSLSDSRAFAVALEDASRELLYAMSLSRLGNTAQAKQVLDAMLATPELRDMGSIYWTALYERSRIDLEENRRDDAIQRLQQAADAIERVRGSIAFEAGKVGFAGNTQAVYAALVRALAEQGDWTGAFLAAERAKARALVDLLAEIRDLAPPPQSNARVRELLARASVDESRLGFAATVGAPTRDAPAGARSELAKVAPEAASLLSVQSVPLAAIAARLAADETLIDYFATGDDLYALTLNGTTVKGRRLPATGLAAEVRDFRAAIEREDPAVAERGRALYDRLIRPLAADITGTRLTISPHGVLHYLPFAALRDGEHYLVDRYSLRLMPSASALAYLKTDKPKKSGELLALGNPDLGNPAYDLPSAEQEAVAVARLFPASTALVRKEATKSALLDLGGSFSILHFASHGVFEPAAPLSSALLLAGSGDSDGRLTVSDLYSLRLDAELVTLSACQTALGTILTGDDVIGLSRGFLYAGARTIVASLWAVADVQTEKLMIAFYRRLATSDARDALRLAQIEIRKTYPAPRDWAAFEVTGSAN